MIVANKIIITILWLTIFYNWAIPFDGMVYTALHWLGIFMIVAHIVEMGIFFNKAKQAGGNIALHMIQLFLYGYFHNLELDKTLADQT